jgi:DNA-binding CsgD family transcriptional regulator
MGFGSKPKQRSRDFLEILDKHMKEEGLSEAETAKLYSDPKNGFPFTVADLRAARTHSVAIQTEAKIRQAQSLKDKGLSTSEIGRRMGVNESSVRSLLEPGRLDKLNQLQQTSNMLKREVEEKGKGIDGSLLDVGAHVERALPIADNPETKIGISKDKFNTALSMLKEEGYAVQTFRAPQQGTGEMTNYRVLFKPPRKNMTNDELRNYAFVNRNNIQVIAEKSADRGRNWKDETFKKPLNIDPKRVGVRYKEDGGADADGVIYVRPGVKDISLGKAQYAQVRVAVGGTHYLKGMAVYKNDLPKGVDLQFNTNKSNTGNKLDALKPLKKVPLTDKDGRVVKKDGKVVDSDKVDWTNPFGSFPKIDGGQILDEHGNVTSAMNKLYEQGDWNKWSRNLSMQVLAKQSPDLAKTQLDVTFERKRQEFADIKGLNNALIKRKLLETFSDEVDSSGVHLKAANMPRQATKVLLPVNSMKPTEVYAPSFANGTRVSLVRFPHAGTFEIPQLTVNNRNEEAQKLLTPKGSKEIHAPDVIGIHPKVAERLSGADFDGDAVVVVPHTKAGKLEATSPLEGLKGFDPQKYKVPTPEEDPVTGRKTVTDSQKQDQMGRVTNLITDMTVRGASPDKVARAVRHSMVVIDSEKHNLDYKASERDHGIIELKHEFQGTAANGQPKGASTLMTRATSEARPFQRRDAKVGPGLKRLSNATVDVKTGEKVYELKDVTDAHGKPVNFRLNEKIPVPTEGLRTFRSRKLAETKNAFDLVSDRKAPTPIETLYAHHSNRLKKLADEARLEAVRAEPLRRSKSAAKVYDKEVKSLKGKLNEAYLNKPLERRAHRVADSMVAQRKRANPEMEKSELKKIKGQALEAARARVGAKKIPVDITDREWEAIQHGAISINMLHNILQNTDIEKLRERATPKTRPVMTPAVTQRAKMMRASGATDAEIADALGIPVSTIQSGLEGG